MEKEPQEEEDGEGEKKRIQVIPGGGGRQIFF